MEGGGDRGPVTRIAVISARVSPRYSETPTLCATRCSHRLILGWPRVSCMPVFSVRAQLAHQYRSISPRSRFS